MAKDPAILFYTSDFLAGTLTMTDEQVGKYIRLLCLQHQKGGKLSEHDMYYICKTYDEHVFLKFSTDEQGNFYNQRMLEETEKRKKYSESRKANISKRYLKENKDNSSTYVEHMENENGNENRNINSFKEGGAGGNNGNGNGEIELRKKIDELWKIHPRPSSRYLFETAMVDLSPDEILFREIKEKLKLLVQSDQWTRDNCRYAPKLHNWINQKGWMDAAEARDTRFDFLKEDAANA